MGGYNGLSKLDETDNYAVTGACTSVCMSRETAKRQHRSVSAIYHVTQDHFVDSICRRPSGAGTPSSGPVPGVPLSSVTPVES